MKGLEKHNPSLNLTTNKQILMKKRCNEILFHISCQIDKKKTLLLALQKTFEGEEKEHLKKTKVISILILLQGRVALATGKADIAEDYTTTLAHMKIRDKLNRIAKQRPFEEVQQAGEYLTEQIFFIREHSKTDLVNSAAFRIRLMEIQRAVFLRRDIEDMDWKNMETDL